MATARRRGRNRVRVRTPEEEEAEEAGSTRQRMARTPELRSEDSGSEAGRSSRSPRHKSKSSPRKRRLETGAWAWPEGWEHWVLLAALAAAVCAAVPTDYHAPLLLPCLVMAVARSK